MQIDVLVDNSAAARSIMGDLRRALESFVEELHAGNEIADELANRGIDEL